MARHLRLRMYFVIHTFLLLTSSSSPKTSTTSTSSSKNAANPIEVSYGVAGILGMVIAAVLA
jgi:hypothetical protein